MQVMWVVNYPLSVLVGGIHKKVIELTVFLFGGIDLSECPKIGIQYQRLQDLMTKLDFSLLPSTFDIVKPLTNFVNNESFIKFSERFEKFENNTLINASSELHATLSSLCKMNLCSSTALQNRFSELSKIDFSKMFSASSLLSNIYIA